MKWRKTGLVYGPAGHEPWARSHAMLPTPLLIPELGIVRIFINCCDEAGVSRPGFVDVLPDAPTVVVNRSSDPLMDIGHPGTFDENGVLCTSVLRAPDGRLYMYYVGFELGTRIRYRLLTGLAISEDNGVSFTRYSVTPVLERSPDELFFRCGPCVRLENGLFRMWYVAGSEWLVVGGKPMPRYCIKYLESMNGLEWGSTGRLVLDITREDEHGFGRPWVVQSAAGYAMYYSVRRKSFGAYRMGFATSLDALNWDRHDEDLGLDVEPGGFDSDAIMYAAVIYLDGKEVCYYNGNEFGRAGFGAAIRTAV